jgi:hypothetical protein
MSMKERDNESGNAPDNVKLSLKDKIWIAAVIAAFVIGFVLIVIYDVI